MRLFKEKPMQFFKESKGDTMVPKEYSDDVDLFVDYCCICGNPIFFSEDFEHSHSEDGELLNYHVECIPEGYEKPEVYLSSLKKKKRGDFCR